MYAYRLGGMLVGAAIQLPELVEVADREAEWFFEVAGAQRAGAAPAAIREVVMPNGQPWLSVGRDNGAYHLRFWDLADFIVRPDAGHVSCIPSPELPSETLRHLFLDQVVPLLLSMSGRTTLHASAVVTESGAVGFLGESGMGKSTLAASFAVVGADVLADDCLVLFERQGKVFVVPMYPSLRLWPDSMGQWQPAMGGPRVAHYGSKRRFEPSDRVAHESIDEAPLTALFLLDGQEPDGGNDISIEPVPARDAFIEVFRSLYRLDPDAADHRQEFLELNRLLDAVSVARLRFRRDYSALPQVRGALLAALESSATASWPLPRSRMPAD